jgi:hypothetical protein
MAAPTRCRGLSRSLDCSYLGVALPSPDNVATRLCRGTPASGEPAIPFRSEVGFVLADDGKTLFAFGVRHCE